MPDIAENISSVLTHAAEHAPPRNSRDITPLLREHESSIRSAIAQGWSPSALAQKIIDSGVKVSKNRLQRIIRDIAGIPPRSSIKGKEHTP